MTWIRVRDAGASPFAVVALIAWTLVAATPAVVLAQDAPWAEEDPEALFSTGLESPPAEVGVPTEERGNALDWAWLAPAASLDERVSRTRRAALELGIWNFDAGARAVSSGRVEGDALERSRAAVRLAPDLPAGHMDLARALWLQGDQPMSALRTTAAALAAVPRHFEASLWFGGWALCVLSVALVVGGLLSIGVAGAMAAPHAAHDLADLLGRNTSPWGRAALLASAVLAPLAMGEGLAGMALVVFLMALIYGKPRLRAVLTLAAAGIVIGAYPVARLGGNALIAFEADPVVEAVLSTSQGFALYSDIQRLEAAAARDPLALQALAVHARQAGNLGEADRHYQVLLKRDPDDPIIANNAANIRLSLGHMESALELYRHSIELTPSPVVLFNLSQAYGRAFLVDDLGVTLAEAQRLDGDLVAELTGLQGADPQGFVVDLPLSPGLLWERILRSNAGEPLARQLRASVFAGVTGRNWRHAASAFGLIAVLSAVVARRQGRSRWCPRCGTRMCPRCDPELGSGDLCDPCAQLYYRPDATDRARRLARVNALRRREERLSRVAWVASLVIPGAAGLLAKRPIQSLLGSIFFATAITALFWRDGIVPDPSVGGAAGPLAFLSVTIAATVAYAAVVGASLASRRRV